MSGSHATNTDPLQRLAGQPPVAWVRERDIDLLICAELHAGGPLRRRFAQIADAAPDDFLGAWVSHAEDEGETDLVVGFGAGSFEALLLVENKVSAEYQPDQPQRYRARANRFESTPPHPRVRCVLLAPDAYSRRAGSDVFDAHLGYEALIEVLAGAEDTRSGFLSDALRRAMDGRPRYVPDPDAAVTDLWRAIYEVATKEAPLLRMPPPGEKPKGSRFIYCTPDGFAPIAGGTDIVIKNKGDAGPTERTFVDLQFRNMRKGELEHATAGTLDGDMFIETAGKSASIRIDVCPLDYQAPADPQLAAIRQAVEQADRLRRFFLEHGDRWRSRWRA